MAATAWHLRQDGTSFPVKVHLYPMKDEDLSSEAEIASFLIKTKSKDLDLAQYVIDAWLALMIEETVDFDADSEGIIDAIHDALSENADIDNFEYRLSDADIINIHKQANNYNDVDSLYEFVDKVRDKLADLQSSIAESLNQQFCRVRFGGKYDSEAGNNGIWFRISSTNYNWNNTIYTFVADMRRKLKIDTVTICRDLESDIGYNKGGTEYFYQSKDRTPYRDMAVNEFLSEEHGSSPVFSSTSLNEGVLATIRKQLANGNTMYSIAASLETSGISIYKIYSHTQLWRYMLESDIESCCILDASLEEKFSNAVNAIMRKHSEIDSLKIEYNCSEDAIIYTTESNELEMLDHLEIHLPLGSHDVSIDNISESVIVTLFENELSTILYG